MDAVREAALKTLYEVEKNGAYSNIALKNELALNSFSDRDRHFATSIVYGVIDKKLTLDYVIKHYSKIKLKKLSPYILLILRMGIYQILFMDKIPDNAAVNECVTLAKRYGHKASSGYVNGVLRSVIRGGVEYPKDKEKYLEVKYSYPEWLVKMWLDDFGYEFTEQLMEAFSKPAELTLRPNTLKITAEELCEKLLQYNARVSDGAVICDGFDIAKSDLYKDGYFSVQDKAAQAAAVLLAPKPEDIVIDMCAAPGGKTTHMAELMENKGEILAFDIYEHKTELIEKNAQRLGIDIIKTRVFNAAERDESLIKTADCVLCDVPCSGLGIIGRKPEIKWNRPEDLSSLYETQKRILTNGAAYVKDGGTIVYSTCTINRRENEETISAFLSQNKDFEKEFEKTYYPHIDNTDGFYICRLKRIK